MTGMKTIQPVPVVNGVIFNDKGELLLTRRSKMIRQPGQWCIPGGHLEGGESWVQAMRREMNEEVGLTVTKETLLGIYSDPKSNVQEGYGQGGAPQIQFVAAVFLIKNFQGEVSPNHEVDAWDWFSRANLPTPLLGPHVIRVSDAFEFSGKVFVR